VFLVRLLRRLLFYLIKYSVLALLAFMVFGGIAGLVVMNSGASRSVQEAVWFSYFGLWGVVLIGAMLVKVIYFATPTEVSHLLARAQRAGEDSEDGIRLKWDAGIAWLTILAQTKTWTPRLHRDVDRALDLLRAACHRERRRRGDGSRAPIVLDYESLGDRIDSAGHTVSVEVDDPRPALATLVEDLGGTMK
jgi:hypothetical protein